MSQTTATLWAVPVTFADRPGAAPLLRALGRAARIGGTVAGGLCFAIVMWLLVAGPGFLSDDAGHHRAVAVAHR